MVFECEGVRYDTADMEVHETGALHEPFVFVTPDLNCVFVQTMDHQRGVGIHQAGEAEIRRLWDAYGIASLLRALSVLGADAGTGQGGHAAAPARAPARRVTP